MSLSGCGCGVNSLGDAVTKLALPKDFFSFAILAVDGCDGRVFWNKKATPTTAENEANSFTINETRFHTIDVTESENSESYICGAPDRGPPETATKESCKSNS